MTGKQTEKDDIPTAPPVSGDGDASLDADVREILARRGLPDSLFPVGLNDRIASVVREGLARGRALGAREAEKFLRSRADVAYVITDTAAPKIRTALHNAADAIARRAGREGK